MDVIVHLKDNIINTLFPLCFQTFGILYSVLTVVFPRLTIGLIALNVELHHLKRYLEVDKKDTKHIT